MDERLLAERLVGYDTSRPDGLRAAGGFVKGWLESHGIDAHERDHDGLPVLLASVGPADGPTVIFHGHLDVVPGHAEQFVPRIEGQRLYGRGTYDMKGGLAAMLCALRDCAGVVHARDGAGPRVQLVVVPDEESEQVDRRSTDTLVREGVLQGDFAITGEPTELQIGVQAKGVLAVRAAVHGTSAHGSTPWAGDNAILKAFDAFRRIETLPFSRQSSDLYDRPSINLSRISGGEAFNMVPDRCEITIDIRYVPGQDPEQILGQIRAIPDVEVLRVLERGPAIVSRSNPFVVALRDAVGRTGHGAGLTVGRDGASDAFAFLEAGIPAVEFGPEGHGHHGPEEWVSIPSLARYRRSLVEFVRAVPAAVARNGGGEPTAAADPPSDPPAATDTDTAQAAAQAGPAGEPDR
ncbi:M20 family metallopeptidase [Patulibacter defluvii]|uniref:M20 family metallopeptidase n=1 Tax=Patulibacter defluvii TaxID=3095358 RepID=UPI002A7519D8|nr:M20/M25/M40 family metallo-hydrolase [Patulibacter sp. DM4]